MKMSLGPWLPGGRHVMPGLRPRRLRPSTRGVHHAQRRLRSLPAFRVALGGGFVDHPNDPGGRTNKGVTQKVYDAWRKRQGLPVRDVKRLDDTELHRIYESGYWIPPHCDRLARQLDLVHFDTAVNMGPGRAVRFLQKAAGCGVDGDFGSQTEKAVQACRPGDLIASYCATREAYYRELVRRNASLGCS
jgi:lysozyme family protein